MTFADTWILSGPPGLPLDALIVCSVMLGMDPEPVVVSGSVHQYRVAGDAEHKMQLVEMASKHEGHSVEPEVAPATGVYLSARISARNSARTTVVYGADPSVLSFVARAVGSGLSVALIGPHRYAVTGPTSRQMAWLAIAEGVPLADILSRWNLTPDLVAAEDASALPVSVRDVPVPLPVSVLEFPSRQSETVLSRDESGQLLASTTTERTVHDSAK